MHIPLFEKLHSEGLISDDSLQRVKLADSNCHFSIYWELKTVLYLGIVLLTTGLGILIYKNIDTIGHQVILVIIAFICAGCFFYCVKKKKPFSRAKVESPNAYFDYILLLGCLTFITFITYLQVQYRFFGNAYGSATFIPMLVLFLCAYYFDHLGVLTMAITNLAAWIGIAVTPMRILRDNNFSDTQLIIAGLVLGVFLSLVAHFSNTRKIKSHFAFTYLNFGMNIFFIASLAGMFEFDSFFILWALPVAAAAWYYYRKAVELSSFYILVMVVIYVYIAAGYVVAQLLPEVMLTMMYFIASGIYTIILLMNLNKKIRKNVSIQ